MNATGKLPPAAERGFILMTSLIFLVVLTLLAVSAMNASTLEEKMASNLRARSRALQGANAGLAQAESLLSANDFLTCLNLLNPRAASQTQGSCSSAAGTFAATKVGIGSSSDASATFIAPAYWSSTNALAYSLPDTSGNPPTSIQFRVDYIPDASDPPDDLMFRITARADGPSPAARAITQSMYEIRR